MSKLIQAHSIVFNLFRILIKEVNTRKRKFQGTMLKNKMLRNYFRPKLRKRGKTVLARNQILACNSFSFLANATEKVFEEEAKEILVGFLLKWSQEKLKRDKQRGVVKKIFNANVLLRGN